MIPRTAHAAVLASVFVFGSLGLATAGPVSINAPAGQGLAVQHRNNCYVLLPAHVYAGDPELSLSTGSPPVVGAAYVVYDFSPTDLALAVVTGGLEGRCNPRFSDLPRDIGPMIAPGGEVSVVTVQEGGWIERLEARVAALSYEHMEIDLVGEAAGGGMFQGRSGAVVYSGDIPVGLVIEAIGPGRARVLRMDAIVSRIERRLAGDTAEPGRPSEPAPTEASASGNGLFGLAGEVSSCSAEGVRPDAGCWSLADGHGPLLIPAGSLPFRIELRLVGENASPVSLVRLYSDPDDKGATVPRTVIVERAAGAPGREFWLSFANADMSPRGVLEIVNGAAPRTRALRITVVDAWEGSLPIRLDRIEVR